MIDAGRARAASVGWPDAYAFTKALGEQALTDVKGPVPVSIVRPSIIESALAEPRPGWIRGFRMAEPVLISYARGLLDEFPGVPEGTVDVIPVDIVVAAIIAVAALGPERAPEITQVASGGINPLKYRMLVDNVSGWFLEHPIYDAKGQPIVVPEFRFPGRGRVQGQLNRAKTILSAGEKVLQNLPLRGRQAEWSAQVETKRAEVERALTYVELYGLYTECEAIYQVDNLMLTWGELDDADRAVFNFDPRSVDWPTYITQIHLPSIVKHARVKTTPGPSPSSDRMARLRKQVLDPKRQVVAFDLENTLISSNVVESYSWLATRRLDTPERLRYVLRTLAEGPGLLKLDRADRSDFLRYFYRRYEDAPVEQIEADAREMFGQIIMTKSFPEGMRRVRQHRALGHRTILITGALSFNVEGLRPLFDEIVAAEMTIKSDNTYSGEMHTVPPTGEARGTGARRLLRRRRLRPRRVRRLRRLVIRPPAVRGGRLPRGGQPRDATCSDRPQAWLARRTLEQGAGRPPPATADRPAAVGTPAQRALRSPRVTHPRLRVISDDPVHPFRNTNVDAAWAPCLRVNSDDPVHPFCNANVMAGVGA